ncbi:MAG: hypothetical protein K2Y05_04865 [Hyphomicrobiaceae bacterium]|nr:hypothetical protein [Hyphomicrobiaceae bacterium]
MGAASLMWPIWVILFGKVLTLIGSAMQIVGLLTFVGFDWSRSLEPSRWWLILGGTALIIVTEGALYLFNRRMLRRAENEGDPDGKNNSDG